VNGGSILTRIYGESVKEASVGFELELVESISLKYLIVRPVLKHASAILDDQSLFIRKKREKHPHPNHRIKKYM
jgi:hypothetical protein